MAKRTPMPLESPPQSSLTVLGIDPGWASTGVAVLRKYADQSVECLHAGVIRTEKSSKKDLRSLRVSADDTRRMKELHVGLAGIADAFDIQVLAYEVYSPYGKQGGNAWKASRAEGGVQIFGLERGMVVLPFLPQDLKRAFCGKVSASKDDVIEAMSKKVKSLEAMLLQLPKTMREHAADAAGHAYLAFEEMYRMRAMMGL